MSCSASAVTLSPPPSRRACLLRGCPATPVGSMHWAAPGHISRLVLGLFTGNEPGHCSTRLSRIRQLPNKATFELTGWLWAPTVHCPNPGRGRQRVLQCQEHLIGRLLAHLHNNRNSQGESQPGSAGEVAPPQAGRGRNENLHSILEPQRRRKSFTLSPSPTPAETFSRATSRAPCGGVTRTKSR